MPTLQRGLPCSMSCRVLEQQIRNCVSAPFLRTPGTGDLPGVLDIRNFDPCSATRAEEVVLHVKELLYELPLVPIFKAITAILNRAWLSIS